MTETDWLTIDAPLRLLPGLGDATSERKLLLFACACTRQVEHLLTDKRSRQALAACEKFAYSARSGADVFRLDCAGVAALEAVEAVQELVFRHPTEVIWRAREIAAVGVLTLTRYEGLELVRVIDNHVADALRTEAGTREAGQIAATARADLLRDIFGNPWRLKPVDPSWLTWNAGTVPRLAQMIYDECRFADMNILADALLDAGCSSETILAHCRSPKPHVRGCWVIDALLEKS